MKQITEYHSPVYKYLKTNRQVGHTTLLKDGALNAHYPFIILGGDLAHATTITKEIGNPFAKPMSMAAIEGLRGTNNPVLIDNYVFTKTCEGYIATIRDYRENNISLINELEVKEQTIKTIMDIPFWIRLFKPLYKKKIKQLNK